MVPPDDNILSSLFALFNTISFAPTNQSLVNVPNAIVGVAPSLATVPVIPFPAVILAT